MAALLLAAGCGETKLPTIDEVKQAATDAATQAAADVQNPAPTQPAAPPERFELSLGRPVTTTACYGRVTPPIGDRPTVLQVASYPDAAAETFPSVLLWARLPQGPGSLAGATVQALVYVQEKKDGPVWHTPDGAPVEVQITQAADGKIAGAITGGSLVSTEGGATTSLSGSFRGSLQ